MGEQFFEHTLSVKAIEAACDEIRRELAEVKMELDRLTAYKAQAETAIAELETTVASQRATIAERDASILAMGQRYAEAQTAIRLRDETIRRYQARANDAISTLQGENDGDLDL